MSEQWALVTGATGGIGEQFCRLLARRGWSVVVSGRNDEKLARLVGEIKDLGGQALAVRSDLSVPGAAEQLVDEVDELGVTVGLLINNAGLGYNAAFVQSDLSRQRALVQVDVMAPTELSHIYGKRMADAGSGAILNVASVAGTMPGPGMSTYFASKAYVLSLTQAIHDELAPYGVKAMALCPGPVATAFWDVAESNVGPIDAIMLTPEEVARIALTALDHNRAVCAPGLVSKVCYGFGRACPAWLSRKVALAFNKM